ncbi:MAG: hypothetical protein HC789_20540 [Microcoleus sp. CSU_2_2]|nr:hypothetical protein [Microcoleus sp. CSU_2_2]
MRRPQQSGWEARNIRQRRTVQHTVGCISLNNLVGKLEHPAATHHATYPRVRLPQQSGWEARKSGSDAPCNS